MIGDGLIESTVGRPKDQAQRSGASAATVPNPRYALLSPQRTWKRQRPRRGWMLRQGKLAMEIAKECVFLIHYTLTDDRGEELIQEVPLDVLSGIDQLQVSMRLQSRSPDGQMQMLTVDAIGAESATQNANHVLAGLAGEVLHFDVAIEHVREATAEKLDRGLQG